MKWLLPASTACCPRCKTTHPRQRSMMPTQLAASITCRIHELKSLEALQPFHSTWMCGISCWAKRDPAHVHFTALLVPRHPDSSADPSRRSSRTPRRSSPAPAAHGSSCRPCACGPPRHAPPPPRRVLLGTRTASMSDRSPAVGCGFAKSLRRLGWPPGWAKS